MKNNIKKYSLTAALQAGAAYDFAILKSRRQFKREKSDKKKYVPGKLGLSAVSTAIKKEFGTILSRKERRKSPVFQKFYAQGGN
ncbi:hypothetical protein [Paenibacillus crassostreae]|uniref:Uncharacterized protein n=1 Tax=Paenibacillus crassostreae TaxID=1763538 RepID=A0A162KRN2_9BACL|nr:hypothetical protein [Paenibacillus crassostreae]AOZ91602.1 hypothetical protein LPB68_04810 [Paenibacillus crassostreae]OAB72823.1 hypothetical protein PNBC_15440 [Paenibacillus crassostreae]